MSPIMRPIVDSSVEFSTRILIMTLVASLQSIPLKLLIHAHWEVSFGMELKEQRLSTHVGHAQASRAAASEKPTPISIATCKSRVPIIAPSVVALFVPASGLPLNANSPLACAGFHMGAYRASANERKRWAQIVG